MPFESTGEQSYLGKSPGGFEFGVQGWVWGQPRPTSITFFLDNTAMVCDQYGRQIRRSVSNDGQELRFADTPPEASRENGVEPRPQFATHQQVIAALKAENINWLGYEVRYLDRAGQLRSRNNLTLEQATELQSKLIRDECRQVVLAREIACAGWPQLPYDKLKALPELPPTPLEELRKITDPELRKAAIQARRECDGVREKELQAAMSEE